MNQVEETKVCKHCKEIVNAGAKKCPHCTGDLRSWVRRHPILTFIFGMFLFGFIISTSSDDKQQKTDTTTNKANDVKTTLPVMNLYGKSEEIIKSTLSNITTDYFDTGLTPSKKIKITGFDIKNTKINVQIDYSVRSGKPHYIGYSFSEEPLTEEEAWNIVGFKKPELNTKTNQGVMNRKVYYWEDSDEIYPFKSVQAIYESNGKVGKIAFGMEDYDTAKGSKSLYYVP